jgi:hypothetical protein
VAQSANARTAASSAPGPPADPPELPPPAAEPTPVPVVGAVGAGAAGRAASGAWDAAEVGAAAVRAVGDAVKPGRPMAGTVAVLAGVMLDAARPAGLAVVAGGHEACAAANGTAGFSPGVAGSVAFPAVA